MARLVEVGDPVQWFNGGKIEEGNDPQAGFVLAVNPGDMLTLLVFDQYGQPHPKYNVWRIGSDILKRNPTLAVRSGAWEMIPPSEVNGKLSAVDQSAAEFEEAPFEGTPDESKKRGAKRQTAEV